MATLDGRIRQGYKQSETDRGGRPPRPGLGRGHAAPPGPGRGDPAGRHADARRAGRGDDPGRAPGPRPVPARPGQAGLAAPRCPAPDGPRPGRLPPRPRPARPGPLPELAAPGQPRPDLRLLRQGGRHFGKSPRSRPAPPRLPGPRRRQIWATGGTRTRTPGPTTAGTRPTSGPCSRASSGGGRDRGQGRLRPARRPRRGLRLLQPRDAGL